jgi:hypothetical protein
VIYRGARYNTPTIKKSIYIVRNIYTTILDIYAILATLWICLA